MSLVRDIEKLVKRIFHSLMGEVRTHMPAQIVSYDADENLCSVQPCIRVMRTDDPNNMTTTDLPVLEDVPVWFPGSGKCLLTTPPQVGSYGVLHVSDRKLEKWLTDGGLVDPISAKRFDTSDSFFQPGLYPLATDGDNGKLQSAVNTDRTEIRTRDGDSYIALVHTDDTVTINGSETVLQEGTDYAVEYTNLKAAFDKFKADFNTFVTVKYNVHNHPTAPPGVVSVPSVVGTSTSADMSDSKVDDVRVSAPAPI